MRLGFNYLCVSLFILLVLSCQKDENEESKEIPFHEVSVKTFSFLSDENPHQLVKDAHGTIIGDSVIEVWIPYLVPDKKLKPSVGIAGGAVLFNGIPFEEGKSIIDFSKPIKMTVQGQQNSKDYQVYVFIYTGLPVMWIETEGRKEIDSKEKYLKASFRFEENVITRSVGEVIIDSVQIKGRGNSSWDERSPKKSYRLKFDKKVSLCDEHEDKSWVLIANYFDKTMLHNKTAYYMGSISNLEYTPKCHFVELMLNGHYNGTYLLCEKIKVANHRVNIGDDGYLLEIDSYAYKDSDSRTFTTHHLPRMVNIKEPEVEYDDEKFNYIRDYILTAESVLFSDSFADKDNGWQKYFDLDSFVDWYLINEIAKNHDAPLITSCYMNLKPGGKLKMGPIWDFDTAFGNIDYDNNWPVGGWWVKNAKWFARMYEDPIFVEACKKRFDYLHAKKDDIIREINNNGEYLHHSVIENDNKWHTLYTYTFPNYDIWGSYFNEVQCFKMWLNGRFEWLKNQFDTM